jgi:hypothetical protein
MYDIIRYPQFDIDYNTSDGEEEVDCEPFYQTSEEEQSNIKSIGSLQSDEALKFGFEALPSETLLQLLLYLNDPFDIVSLSAVNQFFHAFIQKNSTSLARQLISVVELRGSYANEDDDKVHSIVMNLTGTCYGSKRLWKGLSFEENTINKINIEMFAPKMFFADESVIRMDNIEITKACLPSFTRFIEKMIRIDYPGCRRKIEFELQINDCSFKKASRHDIHHFIDTMIEYGCTNLTFNSVAFEDYTKICRALSQSQLHLLNAFRFHSDDITTNRAKTLQYIFQPFCNLGRKTTKLVIDGIMIPLEICEWVMVQFCCTPFYTSPPPALRIVMSIHRNYTRHELFHMLKGVRIGVEEQRKKLKRRLNHVYLELGMYESDVYLTQNQHCVVDVTLPKPKPKNVQQQQSGEVYVKISS